MEQRSTDDVPLSEFDDKSGLDVDGSIQSNPDYQRAMRLAAVEDPPEEPFISKYEAREILESLQDTTDSPSAKAVIRAAIGCNLIETEQYSEGGAMVMEVLETLQLDYTVNYIEIFQWAYKYSSKLLIANDRSCCKRVSILDC
uniref:Uncharacterized protein n=1 Tax=Spongospora subterranea TaxID=70186 RepID=A0A0H5QQF4_9EUKA|eukprot:CRZ04271.1 hypothetical protein [Spongospora subterranea]